LLASNRPGVAAYYLSSLLPLAFRQGTPPLYRPGERSCPSPPGAP
jgi:hypothetical protein